MGDGAAVRARSVRALLQALKRKHGSLYAAAKAMQIRLQVLSNYDKGRSLPDDVMAIRLADELGLPRDYVLAMVAAERADRLNNPKAASTWRELAEKLGVAVVAAVTLALVQLSPVEQPELQRVADSPTLYIMLNLLQLAAVLVASGFARRRLSALPDSPAPALPR